MRQEDVVVLRQETRRRGRVGIWQQPVRHVEELAASLVAERAQPRPKPFEDLPESAQTRPGPRIRDRRGAERAQVAEDQPVG